LIQALLYFSTGYCSKAVQKLEAAISRAESSYFIQVFVEIYQCFPDFENLIVSMASTKNSHAGAIQSPFRVAVISLAERTSRTVMSASDLPRSHIDQVEVLTDRELQILQLLTKGCRNKEIGRQISVSEDTVKWHLKNIFSKLGVSSRVEAALCVSAT
jgi:LuxR family maltose regulon positive regulatory protein